MLVSEDEIMVAKKIIIGLSSAILISAVALFVLLDKTITETEKKENTQSAPVQKKVTKPAEEKKYDLYTTTPYDLPFSSIVDISKLPDETKKQIDTALEQAQGFYYLKKDEDGNIFAILQNPTSNTNTYPRHNIEFMEITNNGINFYSPVYAGIDGETINAVTSSNSKPDNWKFDKSTEPYRPVKHTAYDENGKTKFTEYWDYSDDNEIKYIMKTPKGKIISIMKETLQGDSNYRREHLFYNDQGNIEMSLSANYDGANVSRFTFFDSIRTEENISIISEFDENGYKIKETLYNKDYQLVKTLKADIIDGERKTIRVFDIEQNEIDKISS